MKFKQHVPVQVSESFWLCALLTMTGGFLDVYTYVTRGQVFANAQTGNIVLLGLNIAEGHIRESLYYLLPIAAFALGILFVEWIRARFREYSQLHWRQIVVFLEALLLLLPAFMVSGAWDTQVNILISFVWRGSGGKFPQGQRTEYRHDHVHGKSENRDGTDILLSPFT